MRVVFPRQRPLIFPSSRHLCVSSPALSPSLPLLGGSCFCVMRGTSGGDVRPALRTGVGVGMSSHTLCPFSSSTCPATGAWSWSVRCRGWLCHVRIKSAFGGSWRSRRAPRTAKPSASGGRRSPPWTLRSCASSAEAPLARYVCGSCEVQEYHPSQLNERERR